MLVQLYVYYQYLYMYIQSVSVDLVVYFKLKRKSSVESISMSHEELIIGHVAFKDIHHLFDTNSAA